MLEEHLRFDRTHWNNNRDKLTDNHIRKNFSYTWYALYHYLAFQIYQNENAYNKKVGSRDFEYLYYLHSTNVFIRFHRTHSTKNTLLERGYLNQGSTVHLPTYLIEITTPDEHDKVMRYIKEGVLY